jgi:TP901 family phage tail tape measure protein
VSVIDSVVIRVIAEGAKTAAVEIEGVTGGIKGMAASATKAFGAAGVAFGLYNAAKASAAFNGDMERLQTQADKSSGEVTRMKKAVLDLAVPLATSPDALALSLNHIESAGYKGQLALMAMTIAAEAAKIGNADLTDTTTGLTAVMVAGFKGVRTLHGAMADLNAAVGAGDMTFQDLNDSLKHGVLATFQVAGLQVKDYAASLAVLGDNNIRGATAGQFLNRAVQDMVKMSGPAIKQLKQIGMQPLQMARDLRKPDGLLKALEDLHDHLASLPAVQRLAAVGTIFGRNQVGPIEVLLNRLDRLKTKYKAATDGEKNWATDVRKTREQQQYLIDQLKALGDVVLIKVGDGFWKVIGFIFKFVDAVKAGKTWAEVIAVALGILAIDLFGITVLTTAWGGAMALISEIPVLLVLVAIAFAIVMLIKHFGTVKRVALDAWHWIENAASNAWHAIKTGVSDFIGFIKAHWQVILFIFTGPFGLLVAFVISHFDQILKFIESLPGKIAHAASGLWDGLKGDLIAVINWIIKQYDSIPLIHGVSIFGHHIGGLPTISRIATGGGNKTRVKASPATTGSSVPSAPLTAGEDRALHATVVVKVGRNELMRGITNTRAYTQATS